MHLDPKEDAMPVAGTPVIDLDSHVEDDLASWERRIEDVWKSSLPRQLPAGPDERGQTVVGNRVLVASELTRHRGERPSWVGTKDHSPRGRVAFLDEAGIDVAVLSPSSSAQNMVWFPDDPRLAAAYCRAQNGYLAEYASEAPDRLKWLGVIPVQGTDEAIAELRRIVEMGAVGVCLKSTPVNGREWLDPLYDPLYAELALRKTPIVFHETKTCSLGAERFADSFFLTHLVAKVLAALPCCASLICGGVLERHPELNVVIVETDTSQWPWWLARMDEHYERLAHMAPELTMRPSEYFRRQMYLGCEPCLDPLFDWAVERLGDGNLVLGTDTPHWDAAPAPEAIAPLLRSEKLSEESKARILGGNAAGLLRI
jgi:aminocarboxymuconate-semialdehyde decarboxylase